jgi:hypothetical protein
MAELYFPPQLPQITIPFFCIPVDLHHREAITTLFSMTHIGYASFVTTALLLCKDIVSIFSYRG